MADLHFGIEVSWRGTGKEGEGIVHTGGQTVLVSGPASMGGKGVGSSPEELLMSGITACYSATLFAVLKRAGLPVASVSVKTDGVVSDYPAAAKFDKLTVSPTIRGGDPEQVEAYREQAEVARARCFVGKTVAGNMIYRVGDVQVEA
ncbi:MAG: OsmC family protein [Mycobacterium leprae]